MVKKKRDSKPKSSSAKTVDVVSLNGESLASPNSFQRVELANLLLDSNNPRLGTRAGQLTDQTAIVDAIVDVFGVDDVLSSLAVNGYFEAEPMVGVATKLDGDKTGGTPKFRIAEGNRRLAACLILAGDPRAKNHLRRTGEFQQLQKEYKREPILSVPVRILTDDYSLLSYLGVRHIAASQPWDSYAKAAWVAKILNDSKLTLEDVSKMIGDQHRTVARSLEGFYFVNQLRSNAHFNPDDSLRPGRGSNPQYPFSWIYTALGYGPVREWLNLNEITDEGRSKEPIGSNKMKDAESLLIFLFGNKSKGKNPAISDSRQIGELAKAIANPESRRLLERGKSVQEVAHLLKPIRDRVNDSLMDAHDSLSEAITPLAEGGIQPSEATDLLGPSKKVRSLAVEVNKKIVELMNADEDK